MDRTTDYDLELLELARLNIQANVLFDLGLLYAPDDIERISVALNALPFHGVGRRKLCVRVTVTVTDEGPPLPEKERVQDVRSVHS
jgi:hypothetical protein